MVKKWRISQLLIIIFIFFIGIIQYNTIHTNTYFIIETQFLYMYYNIIV